MTHESTPAAIRASDMRLIEDLFEMGQGYVLDFSDRTFAEFFQDELGIDIDLPRYATEGGSKAKRLRYCLRVSVPQLRVRTVKALWEYREARRRRKGIAETIPGASEDVQALIGRLGGAPPAPQTPKPAPPRRSTPASTGGVPSGEVIQQLKVDLIAISSLDPQARGYAFERFLKTFFDAYGLAGRASFKLVGEQIDGSFELAGATYLLEAKWTTNLIGAADLRSFNAKVEDKAAWSRGLFVSYVGFSDDGLEAFGRGKRVVCMDGSDMYEMLERGLPFPDVMNRKVRRAAESGHAFVRVRDLFA